GGVSGQGQRQVVGSDTTAIVAHFEQFDAALFNLDIDALRARIQAVLQQFLDHRCRAFDNLTSGNLVGQPRTEQLDATLLTHGWAARVVGGMVRIWPTLITSDDSLL